MYREKITELYKWKNQKSKIPILIKGAKKVGKTWLACTFAKEKYKNIIYILFDQNKITYKKNEENEETIINIEQLKEKISKEKEETVIILDNAENIKPKKQLEELLKINKQVDIIIISSSLNENEIESKIKIIKLYPLNFVEFLYGIKEEELAKKLDRIEKVEKEEIEQLEELGKKYINNIKKYIYIGGMPEVVKDFAETKNYAKVKENQKKIIQVYQKDMEKEGKIIGGNLEAVYTSTIEQITKENKEFDCRTIKKGAKLPEYEPIIKILQERGYVYKINKILKPTFPMSAYQDITNCELFLTDIGLLSCLMNLNLDIILQGNKIFEIENRALEKQFIIQELVNKIETQIYYWKETNMKYQMDFIFQYQAKIYPVKINVEENKLDSSLRWFHQKYQNYSEINITLNTYKWQGWYTNVPIYLVGNIKKIISKK